MPIINVNDADLYYEEFGSGNKIILSSQKSFFSGCFQQLLGQEPYEYHVYLITMRGAGKSAHVYDDFDRYWGTVWAEDVLGFAQKMGIPKFIYTGISHGGFPGWNLAVTHPEVLKAMIAVSGVPFFVAPFIIHPSSEQDIDALIGNREKLQGMAWSAQLPVSDPSTRLEKRTSNMRESLDNLLQTKKEEFRIFPRKIFENLNSEEDLYRLLGRVRTPTLIINGLWDGASTPELAIKAARAIPGSKLIFWEQAEHSTPDECPQVIAREVDHYLRNYQFEFNGFGMKLT
jgi:pimeloyl-ACP methyl ester carboxylesterase